MKQLLGILISCIINLYCFGQNVPLTVKDSTATVQYEKFVRVNLIDFSILINSLQRVKDLEMYNPRVTDKEKVENFKKIGDYIEDLSRRVKVDSALVTKPRK